MKTAPKRIHGSCRFPLVEISAVIRKKVMRMNWTIVSISETARDGRSKM